MKNRILASILAILLGTFGVHKFYLGKRQSGLMCIAFCWTLVPTVMGVIDGINYLRHTQEYFDKHYCV